LTHYPTGDYLGGSGITPFFSVSFPASQATLAPFGGVSHHVAGYFVPILQCKGNIAFETMKAMIRAQVKP
jgi:hypothetical protein